MQRFIQGARKSWSESRLLGESCVTQEQVTLEPLLCATLGWDQPEDSAAAAETAAGSQVAGAGVRFAPCCRSLRPILTPCRRVSYRSLRQLEKAERVPVENRCWLLPRTHTHRVCGRPTYSERYKYIPICKSCASERVPKLLWAWGAGLGTILSR